MEVRDFFLNERSKLSKYRLIKKLGAGAYGQTYIAETRDKRRHILKRVSIKNMEEQNMFIELEILKKLSEGGCKNGILCYEDYFFDLGDCSFYIVTEEFEDSMELFEYIQTLGLNQSLGETIEIMINLADSIKYLHNNDIGHNDIKL